MMMSAVPAIELKAMAGRAALEFVAPGMILGVGTGSTVNAFLDALAAAGTEIRGAVSSSEASSERLRQMGIAVLDCNDVEELAIYIDGADEIDPSGCMIKGGGAALTREKIVAAQSRRFICVADSSKRVDVLGHFPLPVEVVPMSASRIQRQFARGDAGQPGQAVLRCGPDGLPVVTDNGQHILDVHGLQIGRPQFLEDQISQWPGVLTVGIFAHQRADLCLLAGRNGVQKLVFPQKYA